jgi:hypothetical protein
MYSLLKYNIAMHLSRHRMTTFSVELTLRPGDGERWKDGDSRLPLERDSSSSITPAWSY